MRKHSKPNPSAPAPASPDNSQQQQPAGDDQALIQNLIGLGEFSSRKSYYPELLTKIDELEAEKERYKWLFENALHGIFQARDEGPIITANPAIARICGYPSVAAIREVEQLDQLFYTPEDYQRLMKQLHRHGQCAGFETELKTRSGEPVSVSMNVLLKDQQLGLIEAFVQDITERKKAQYALTRLNRHLEQRVQDRTEELSNLNRHLRQEIKERKQVELALNKAKLEAEHANQSKDKYLAAASHDLLQPMNAARLLVSTLQERVTQHRNQQLVERIHVALLGAEELLTDLLDISKLDANALSPNFSTFSIAALIAALDSEFQPSAEKAGLHLRAVVSSATVHSDTRLLMRILRNFISNAIRYTGTGRILIGCRRRGDYLSIEVHDTGPGIPPERLQQIFEEFQQLDNAQPGRDKGVGLGLAIVERIARMLGHSIDVRSTPGRGSSFSIRVPICQQSLSLPIHMPPAATVSADLRDVRVLVIENEEAIIHSMEALLQEWGCQVLTASDAAQALDHCGARLPDIILADYHLDRGETGIEVIQQIRARYCSSLAAVIISADRSDEIRQLIEAEGIRRLNKPLKPGKLRALISHLLNH